MQFFSCNDTLGGLDLLVVSVRSSGKSTFADPFLSAFFRAVITVAHAFLGTRISFEVSTPTRYASVTSSARSLQI